MATISLNKSVRTCKVNTGWADRIQSDRFQNSDLMMCPVWNQRDLAGRKVCADSFNTKRAGCNSSLDRIDVENFLRPQYMEYVTLDAAGIGGNMYGPGNENIGVTESYGQTIPASHDQAYRGPFGKSAVKEGFAKQMYYDDAESACASLSNIHKVTGQFGQNNFRADIYPTCPQYSYEQAMAEVAQQKRNLQMLNHGAHYQEIRDAMY